MPCQAAKQIEIEAYCIISGPSPCHGCCFSKNRVLRRTLVFWTFDFEGSIKYVLDTPVKSRCTRCDPFSGWAVWQPWAGLLSSQTPISLIPIIPGISLNKTTGNEGFHMSGSLATEGSEYSCPSVDCCRTHFVHPSCERHYAERLQPDNIHSQALWPVNLMLWINDKRSSTARLQKFEPALCMSAYAECY